MGSKRKRAAKEPLKGGQPSQKRTKTADASAKLALFENKSLFVDKPSPDDRRREAALYDALGSEDGDERLHAANTIIEGLLGGDGVPGGVLVRHLEQRLFRGLASGRKASRLGFSVVIAEILSQLFGDKTLADAKYSGLTFEKVLGILTDKTKPEGNVPGQEERDHYWGRLFGIECFVRAGILFQDKARWFAVLDVLLPLYNKKVWLRPQCGFVILQAVEQMDEETALQTLKKLKEGGIKSTAEMAGIAVTAQDRCPGLKSKWENYLDPSKFTQLKAVLKESGRESEDAGKAAKEKQKQQNWTSQLHFVWDVILAHYWGQPRKGSKGREEFAQFWSKAVDDGFFAKGATDHQKFSGFMVFQKFLEGGPSNPKLMINIFSSNFMACLMNQAAKEDRYLHRAATKVLKAIEASVEKDPTLIKHILPKLLSENGAYDFDDRTSSKTVDKLLQHTTADNAAIVLDTLKRVPAQESQSAKYWVSYSNYLGRLAHSVVPEVAGPAIEALAKVAYSNPSVPTAARGQMQTKLSAAAAKFVRRPDDFKYVIDAVVSIDSDIAMGDACTSEMKEDVLEPAFTRLNDLLDPKKLAKAKASAELFKALALLHAVAILQLYNREADAVDLLNELKECYDKVTSKKSKKQDSGVSEFLVEILLSMVARPSSLMRQVSQQAFEAFTNTMSAEAIQLLTDPLAAEENARGQQSLFSTEEEDMNGAGDEDDDEGNDEDMLDSDVEIVDAEEENDDSEDEDEGEESDDGAKGNNEAFEALDTALEAALNTHRLDKDKDAEESDDDSDMSDSAMMALDDKLVEIFKHRSVAASKKKDNKDAKKSVINFKNRVLDLLNIFVREESLKANSLVFDVVLSLLGLMRDTSTKPLATRAFEIISTFAKNLKKARTGSQGADLAKQLDAAQLKEKLVLIHAMAAQNNAHAYAKAASTASIALASILCAMDDDGEMVKEVFDIYSRTQRLWFKGELQIQASFFSDWVNWCQSHASLHAEAQAQGATDE